MNQTFKILSTSLLDKYTETISANALEKYLKLEESELSMDTFSFYTSVSAVFSSKIEGVDIDLDSYIKHKRFGIEYLPDYTQKIDDLYAAYQFAKATNCNEANILAVHQLLTKNILPKSRQVKFRTSNMFVTTADGRIEYVAASPFAVLSEMEKFYHDLNLLMLMKL